MVSRETGDSVLAPPPPPPWATPLSRFGCEGLLWRRVSSYLFLRHCKGIPRGIKFHRYRRQLIAAVLTLLALGSLCNILTNFGGTHRPFVYMRYLLIFIILESIDEILKTIKIKSLHEYCDEKITIFSKIKNVKRLALFANLLPPGVVNRGVPGPLYSVYWCMCGFFKYMNKSWSKLNKW